MIWSLRRVASSTALWIAVGHGGVVLLTFAVAMAQVPPAARADLAPTGKLRAGVNYGNFILAVKDPATGESRGVAIDLMRELAQRLGVPAEIVAYDSVAKMVDAAPTRAAYELFLTRGLKRAQLVRAPNGDAAIELFTTGKVEALAGLRQGLIGLAAKHPGSRILDGQFFGVQQAVGVPKGREAGIQYLRGFVEEAKASGLVARAIERTGARGVSVAPKAPVQ